MASPSASSLTAAIPALPSTSLVGAGIGLGALAFALFTVMDAMIKWLSAGYAVHELVFTNALFSLVPVALVSLRRGGIARLRTRRCRCMSCAACAVWPVGSSRSTPTAGCRSRMPIQSSSRPRS
jgi:hypothetical protein